MALPVVVVPIAIIGGVIIAPFAAPPVLGLVGFGAAGPVAGVLAAAAQAGVGNVAAGSAFAGAQAVAMGAQLPMIGYAIAGAASGAIVWGANAFRRG